MSANHGDDPCGPCAAEANVRQKGGDETTEKKLSANGESTEIRVDRRSRLSSKNSRLTALNNTPVGKVELLSEWISVFVAFRKFVAISKPAG